MKKKIVNILLPYIFSKFIKFVYYTNKWKILNDTKVQRFWSNDNPFIWIHWHGQSLMLPNNWRHDLQKLNALVSKHDDGEIIARTLSYLNVGLIRGAGNQSKLGKKEKGGSTALRLMLRVLKKGQSVAFTADQPPGPGKQAGKGSLILAKLSGFPIVPVAAITSRKIEFDNWDNFTINLPFGRGCVVFGEPIYIKKDSSEEDIENMRILLQESLNKIHIVAKETV